MCQQKEKRTAEAVRHISLLFYDFQDLHGAYLCADAAGDALASSIAFFQNHNLHGADLNALATGNAELLVDHVHAGLGILGDCPVFANLFALTALNAGHGLCASALGDDLNAGIIGVEFFIEGVGACTHALQTSHTFCTFFNGELLHN